MGFRDIGALVIRIEKGFGAHYTRMIIRNPQNSIGNYLSSYSRAQVCRRNMRR